MSRYFEIIITGRQLAALVAGVALLVAVAFGLGVSVRLLQPAPAPSHEVIAAAPMPTVGPETAAVPPVPSAAPTPESPPTPTLTATPVPSPAPTEKPKPQPTAAAGIPLAKGPGRWVQVVAFGKRDQAEGVRNRVVALGYTPKQVIVQPTGGGKYRVRVGPFPDGESAGRVMARLRAEGFSGAYVVKPGE
ncbi:MAG: SPOR domain-containing protein [Acidobacteriia bacterium]|nr:SPOR domain-containing protein [Terriglobia bacterium]